jgi:hypothetical protein
MLRRPLRYTNRNIDVSMIDPSNLIYFSDGAFKLVERIECWEKICDESSVSKTELRQASLDVDREHMLGCFSKYHCRGHNMSSRPLSSNR